MIVYNIGFINGNNECDETQLNVKKSIHEDFELINLILSLKDEMDIKEITYIDYVGREEEDE